MKKTMKQIIMIMGILAIGLLVACGNEKTEKAADKKPEMHTVKTSEGDVKVPKKPKRVLVQYVIGDAYALGVTPVGISNVLKGSALEDVFDSKKTKDLGAWDAWDEEAVLALEPDLIIVIDKKAVAKLGKIAPTVYMPYDKLTTEERVTFMGELLGKQPEAKKALADYEKNVATSHDKLMAAGYDKLTVSNFEGGLKEMNINGKKYGIGAIAYESLKLKAPEAIQKKIIDKDKFNVAVSLEVLPEYAGDVIIRNTYEGMDDMNKSKIWTNLPAIKNNRLVEMPFALGFYTDLYSANKQVDFVRDELIKVAK